jgi:hypothetical protein
MHPHIQTWGSMLRLYGSQMPESYLKMENNNENQTEDQKSKMNHKNNESSQMKLKEKSMNNVPEIPKPTDSTASSSSNGVAVVVEKAKPNRELLEKLKEEMRKIKCKPSLMNKYQLTQPNIENEEEEKGSMVQNELLTIPPLLMKNKSEFELSSCNFLMTTPSTTTETSQLEDSANQTNDIIMFSNNDNKTAIKQKPLFQSNESNKKQKLDIDNNNDSSSNL